MFAMAVNESGGKPVVLGYWDIRGLAQPIRFLLAYTKTEFEEKRYICGPPPNFDKSEWLDVKHHLGLQFPNLPYLIDGDLRLTQTNAILRHIGRQHGKGSQLLGGTAAEKATVDVHLEQVMDLRNRFVRLAYNSQCESLLDEYLLDLSDRLAPFEAAVKRDDNAAKWLLASDVISVADFHLYEMLYQHCVLTDDSNTQWVTSRFPHLAAYMRRFEALPAIQNYMTSGAYLAGPINNKMAKFGNA